MIFFVLLVLAQYIMDRSTSICKTYTGEILLFFHHIMAVYIYFGPFFFNPLYHLIFCVIILIHWYMNKSCILTKLTNYYCGVDINRPFHDYVRLIEIWRINRYIHWIILYLLIIYDICLIMPKK